MTEQEIQKIKPGTRIFYIYHGKVHSGELDRISVTDALTKVKCVALSDGAIVPYQFTYRLICDANHAHAKYWANDESPDRGTAKDEADCPSLFYCSRCGCDCDDTLPCGVDHFNFCPVCGARIIQED